MTPSWNEFPVSLDKLDAHLKALLRLKIREFVHLSPCFKEPPVVDPTLYLQTAAEARNIAFFDKPADCPNRKHEVRVSRRRGARHLTRVV